MFGISLLRLRDWLAYKKLPPRDTVDNQVLQKSGAGYGIRMR